MTLPMIARIPCASAAWNAASRLGSKTAPYISAGGRPRRGHRPERRRGDALGGRGVELALEREDVALEPGQQVEPGADARVRELRQVDVEVDHPGQEEQRPEVDAPEPPGRRPVGRCGQDPTAPIRPAASTATGHRTRSASRRRRAG